MRLKGRRFDIVSFVSIGCLSGVVYPIILWCTKLWMKQEGLSNTVIGYVCFCMTPIFFKPYIVRCMQKIPFQRHRWHDSYRMLVLGTLVYSVSLVLLAYVTPHKLGAYFFLISLGVVGACTVDVFVEVMRQQLSQSEDQKERILRYAGIGYRLGGIVVKVCVTALACWLMWPQTFLVIAVTLSSVIFYVSPLNHKLYKERVPQGHPYVSMHTAVRALLVHPSGVWAIAVAFLAPMTDNFLRTMLSMFLMDQGFSLQHIIMTYGFLHVGGIVGVIFTSVCFPQKNIFVRLAYVYSLNMVALMCLTALIYNQNLWLLGIIVALIGVAQGVFLQVFRLFLARVIISQYTVEHTAFLTALWSLSAIVSGVSGALADFGGWMFFFKIGGFLSIFTLLAIYFMHKTSNNAV